MTTPDLVQLSLGAGRQSTTIALLAAEGVLPKPDMAIFADTGWEPRAVYDHLDRLRSVMEAAGIPVLRVSTGNLRDDTLDSSKRIPIPAFVATRRGDGFPSARQCTRDYKLAPIRAKLREILGYPPPQRVPQGVLVEQWVGFSTDEVHRVTDRGDAHWLRPTYPLLDLGMSVTDCVRWLEWRGWRNVPKSACIGCPFHGNRHWRTMRDACDCGHPRRAHRDDDGSGYCTATVANGPAANGLDYGVRCECMAFSSSEWNDAVTFDHALRERDNYAGLESPPYLHRSLLPLDQAPIERRSSREHREAQADIFDALHELDLDEDGDPDGCSPYGCRSGEPA